MKIDLHCHTKASKSGDPIERNINPKDLKKIINSNGVKIIGITNHNEFDYEQYKKFVTEIQNDFLIWQGIELDVKGKIKNGHVIIINNPSSVEKFNEEITKLINNVIPDNFVCELDDVIKLANSLDCLLIAHYMKPKSLDENSIKYLRDGIKENFRFFYEPSQYRSMSILINHNIQSLLGSDVQDWNKYSEYELPNIKLNVDSFEQFVLLAKKDSQIIDTLYCKQNKYTIDVGYVEKENIDFYDNINIVFGTKGTGKSVLLGKVKEYFNKKGRNISYYDPTENKEKIMDKLKVNDSERALSNFGISNRKFEILNIKNWKEKNVTLFNEYYDYVSSRSGNANKDRMKILNITEISGTDKKLLENSKSKINKIDNILNLNDEINIDKYLSKEEYNYLLELYSSVKQKIKKEYIVGWDNNTAIYLSNATIENFKKTVEANTNLKTIPSSTGLTDYIKNRLNLEKNINFILNTFDNKFDKETKMLGLLEEGKKLFIEKSVKMYNSTTKAPFFKTKISDLKDIYNYFSLIKENVYSIDVGKTVTELKEKLESSEISSLDAFLGIIKCFKVDESEYMPSTGEQTMIVLDEALDDRFDVYILDEPEKSLGNSYVNDVLVSQVIKLSKLKKTLIIATHNANIAVRTFPLKSILKEYHNNEYKTYIGNPFTNKLINIKDENDTKDWKEESIKILEGGREAFEERGEIYGNNNS